MVHNCTSEVENAKNASTKETKLREMVSEVQLENTLVLTAFGN